MRFVLAILVSACALSVAATPVSAQDAPAVYAPGNGVSLPVLVKHVAPQYTAEALVRKISGKVSFESVVLSDGTIGEVKFVRSLDPYFGLDEQAFKAMKQWVFKPGLKDGKPVAVRVHVDMTFSTRK